MACMSLTAVSSQLLFCKSGSNSRTSASATSVPSSLAFSASSGSLFIQRESRNINGLDKRKQTIRTPSAVATSSAVEQDKKSKDSYYMQTFTEWLLRQEQLGVIDNELTVVLSSIALACKQIAALVQRAGISNLTGLGGEMNVQGEDQKKLDVVSNQVFSNCLRSSGRTGIIASEEEDVPVAVEESFSGNYIVVFDPLDGSSNIDAAVSTGSIFGVYRPSDDECIVDIEQNGELSQDEQRCIVNVCQPGSNLLAAGYCMYSSSVILVLSVGKGVYGFSLDPTYGEFVLTHNNLKIPKSGKIYAFNEGNYQLWDGKLRKYMDDLKDPGPSGKPYSARYIGSLVGDFHRTMLYGGIFGYPADKKNANGKLRLLYECSPMSFLAEQAGGKGSDGYKRVLDIQPKQVHQRIPFYIGSIEEVEKLEKYLSR
eukprot:TRINITY_DN5914_c0_g1_i1.p1 TRINITY_DN5914_c0_g1~~TRINITY_DN5914_c0_g1_i1.p1  ORF type:complete len:426 (+),score=77.25 TRINITY_DN5914_c0_g1_i1:192-1469(+)